MLAAKRRHLYLADMHARLATLCRVILILGLSGCGDSTDVDFAVGSYTLLTVDGEPLPWVVRVEGDLTLRGIAGFLQIDPVGCRLDATYQATFAGVPAEPETITTECTWSREGSEILFTGLETGQTIVGFLSGDRLSFVNEAIGHVFVYERLP